MSMDGEKKNRDWWRWQREKEKNHSRIPSKHFCLSLTRQSLKIRIKRLFCVSFTHWVTGICPWWILPVMNKSEMFHWRLAVPGNWRAASWLETRHFQMRLSWCIWSLFYNLILKFSRKWVKEENVWCLDALLLARASLFKIRDPAPTESEWT